MNFTGSDANMLAALLADNVDPADAASRISECSVSESTSVARAGFGAFAGYNWQWDDVVVGLEANYLHGKFGGSPDASSSSAVLALSDGFFDRR